MQKLPLGIQDFEKIRQEDFLYVDKTAEIYHILGGSYFFLSRPRRFGKSLLINTLKEIFLGKKHLFEGLWIEDKISWEKHPVIHLDSLLMDYKTLGLEHQLCARLEDNAQNYNLTLKSTSAKEKFRELIISLAQKNRVVILMDEYDKPLVDYLDEGELHIAKENQAILKNFYGVLKGLDKYIRFVFLTGVSKFSRTSIFSELNHLTDLTLHPKAEKLVGYTQTELEHYFDKNITQIAVNQNITKEKLLKKIKKWYNGYSWLGKKIYNPFSVLSFLSQEQFRNFWFETGSPTFLMKVLRQDLTYNFERVRADDTILMTFQLENLHPISLLFQTGYLTIQAQKGMTYTLTYPNQEVKKSLTEHLLYDYTRISSANGVAMDIAEAFENQDFDLLKKILNSLIAKIPYSIFEQNLESYYHAVFFMIFQLLGYYIECEVQTSKGRIDAVLKTENQIFIIEFKVEKSTQNAIAQIRERQYFQRFLDQKKEIILVGIRCIHKTFQDIQVEKL